MDYEVSDIVTAYKDAALIPTPNAGILQLNSDNNIINIYSCWSIPDLIKSDSTKFTKEFLLGYQSEKFSLLSSTVPCDASSVSLCAFTKSGNKFAVLRKGKNEDSVFLEIWNSSKKEKTFDMSDRKEHGKIHDNGDLCSFKWSSDEKYLLYIAEMKHKKSESYYKDLFCQKTDAKSTEEITQGEDFVYRETWGESYTNAHHTVVCIFNTETGKAEVLDLEDKYSDVSAAQATWGPNDEYIVFVGYKETPSRLGLSYCSNRRSAIFSYKLTDKVIECLTSDENICAEYPVFSPNFHTLVYVQNIAGGPHKSCRKLMKYDWKAKETSTVIDIVEKANEKDFAGIYITRLSSEWWSSDSRFFFFHTFRRSFMEIFCVDVFTSKIQQIDTGSRGSSVLLHVKEPYILAVVSSPSVAPCLSIGHFIMKEDKISATWKLVDEDSYLKLQDLSWDVHTLQPSLPNKLYSNLDYDIITVSSKTKKNGTLIIFPHGGPHSVVFVDYYAYVAALARLGYIICLVNYRGSIGFGENSIKSLLGNIGSQDISDVVNAVEYLKKDGKLGIQQVVGFGGSHGGFLVAHLLGQYPDLLKAAVIRNPVIDLSSMVTLSDIPDWCWVESGCSETYDATKVVNPDHLKKMWEVSPIKHMKNVKSPTMLCLGKNDLRVPPHQGKQFYRHLRAQNVPVKVFYYDDNHSLSKVGVSSDAFVQIALWFQQYLSS